MAKRQKLNTSTSVVADGVFPMDEATWKAVAKRLDLPRQQTRVVERILCGERDKEIAATLGRSIPTVRAHLGRVFTRMEVDDRMILVLRIFAITLEVVRSEDTHQK